MQSCQSQRGETASFVCTVVPGQKSTTFIFVCLEVAKIGIAQGGNEGVHSSLVDAYSCRVNLGKKRF